MTTPIRLVFRVCCSLHYPQKMLSSPTVLIIKAYLKFMLKIFKMHNHVNVHEQKIMPMSFGIEVRTKSLHIILLETVKPLNCLLIYNSDPLAHHVAMSSTYYL